MKTKTAIYKRIAMTAKCIDALVRELRWNNMVHLVIIVGDVV